MMLWCCLFYYGNDVFKVSCVNSSMKVIKSTNNSRYQSFTWCMVWSIHWKKQSKINVVCWIGRSPTLSQSRIPQLRCCFVSSVSLSVVAATAHPTGLRASGFAPERQMGEKYLTAAARLPLSSVAVGTTHQTSTRWRWAHKGCWSHSEDWIFFSYFSLTAARLLFMSSRERTVVWKLITSHCFEVRPEKQLMGHNSMLWLHLGWLHHQAGEFHPGPSKDHWRRRSWGSLCAGEQRAFCFNSFLTNKQRLLMCVYRVKLCYIYFSSPLPRS